MAVRIGKNHFYNTTLTNSTVAEIKDILYECGGADVESRPSMDNDYEPSEFMCCVYRLLTVKLTEGLLHSMLNSGSCWIRCAAFLYVRLGMNQDRYWELFSEALMDDEEFVPFPLRHESTMTVGQYVEELLAKDRYCTCGL